MRSCSKAFHLLNFLKYQAISVFDRLDHSSNSALIRPSFSIHSELPSHFLVDSSALHLSVGGGVHATNAVPDTLHLTSVGGTETFHLSSSMTAGGVISGNVVASTSSTSDATLPSTNGFPVFANVCVDPIRDEDATRSGLTSPSRGLADFCSVQESHITFVLGVGCHVV